MKEFFRILGWVVLIALAVIGFLALCVYFSPDAEAGQEPDWNELVPIIIQIESSGNPSAISKAGCIGLMQISPMVLKEWNLNWKDYPIEIDKNGHQHREIYRHIYNLGDLYNGGVNVKIGTWYLKRIWHHYLKGKGTINDMLICYNWGYGNFKKWIRQGGNYSKLPKETQNYIATYKKLAKEKWLKRF